jgi:hypothetical protein
LKLKQLKQLNDSLGAHTGCNDTNCEKQTLLAALYKTDIILQI